MKLPDLVTNFSSLGNNCEFGIVTDVASDGATSSGLFHAVGFLHTHQMITAISAGLDGMFDDGQYRVVKPEGWSDHAIDCLRYGFRFHTGVPANQARPEDDLHRRIIALRYRKKIFMESLVAGDKIFVYRNVEPFDKRMCENLFQAVRRHGPGRLLYVEQDPQKKFASLNRYRNGLYLGAIDKLSNENPPTINFAAWEKLLRAVLADQQKLDIPASPSEFDADSGIYPAPPLARPEASVQVHRHHSGYPLSLFQADAQAGALYRFEAWVYVPARFSGPRVSVALMGWPSKEWTEANMEQRDQWQRVWVVAQAPETHSILVPFLQAAPGSAGLFFSAAWSVHRI